jgi:S-disulfanyl-L-cysteine oxidoreductase SoxD
LRIRVAWALTAAVATTSCATAPRKQTDSPVTSFGFGSPATEAQIRAWDIDVRPDGKGLPAGRGTVVQGASIYAEKCAACHGERGRNGPFEPLVGRVAEGFPFGRDPSLKRTVGSYWPYATTLFDYIRRAMPWPQPQSLTPDEIYSVTAYILFLNGVIKETDVVNAATLPKIAMPNHDNFDNAYREPRHR